MKSKVSEAEPGYIFFRFKETTDAPWALISWIPESTPVLLLPHLASLIYIYIYYMMI